MEKIRRFIIICAIVSAATIIRSAAFGNVHVKYNLLLSLELYRDVIYQYEPVQVKVTLENKGTSPLKVLPLRIGNIDPIASMEASLELELKYPNGKELKTILLEPYYGPISETGPISVEEIMLMSGEKLEIFIYLSANWVWKEKERALLFSTPGEYIVRFKYYPFAKDSKGKRIKDTEKFLYSNEVRLSVLKLTENDEECWNKIRSNSLWWLLYDPEGKNVEYIWILEEEMDKAINEFEIFEKEYPLGIFNPYLQYTRIMAGFKKAKILKNKKKKGADVSGGKAVLSDEEIVILKELADNEKFSYREEAGKLLLESL